ncbi:MAG: hypothetical protein HY303_05900 [Candidatus Wallbacteria bacterium]|nr:hypothetical protein [Candidatus Wallbacteria bacterium]
MPDYKTVESVMHRHVSRLMAFPNVVSVGIGYRQQGGEETEELCISVGVERKLAAEDLGPEGLLPSSLEGVAVDVVETGSLEAM